MSRRDYEKEFEPDKQEETYEHEFMTEEDYEFGRYLTGIDEDED